MSSGFITAAQLELALSRQLVDGGRLGEVLVAAGFLGERQLTQILSHQLSVAWVSLQHVEFTEDLLALVPESLAREVGGLVAFSRIDNHGDRILYVALADPTNIEAMQRIAEATGACVRPLIAPASELRAALSLAYRRVARAA